MLALPDFSGYIMHKWYCDESDGKTPQPKIDEWRKEYLFPQTTIGRPDFTMPATGGGLSPEEAFMKCFSEGIPLIPKDIAVLQVFSHELWHGSGTNTLKDVAAGAQLISGRRKRTT